MGTGATSKDVMDGEHSLVSSPNFAYIHIKHIVSLMCNFSMVKSFLHVHMIFIISAAGWCNIASFSFDVV